MKKILLLLLFLTGCVTQQELYKTRMYGSIDCPAHEIVITNTEEKMDIGPTWRAECRGKSYLCRWGVNERQPVCAEEIRRSRQP